MSPRLRQWVVRIRPNVGYGKLGAAQQVVVWAFDQHDAQENAKDLYRDATGYVVLGPIGDK